MNNDNSGMPGGMSTKDETDADDGKLTRTFEQDETSRRLRRIRQTVSADKSGNRPILSPHSDRNDKDDHTDDNADGIDGKERRESGIESEPRTDQVELDAVEAPGDEREEDCKRKAPRTAAELPRDERFYVAELGKKPIPELGDPSVILGEAKSAIHWLTENHRRGKRNEQYQDAERTCKNEQSEVLDSEILGTGPIDDREGKGESDKDVNALPENEHELPQQKGGRRFGSRHRRFVDEHPDLGVDLQGIQIPHWRQLLELGASCYELTGLGYLGVDIVLDRVHGPLILEINARPGLGIQIANKCGLTAILKTIDHAVEQKMPVPERIDWLAAQI